MTEPTVQTRGQINPNWTDADVPDGYSVVSVGDIIITQPIYEHIRRKSPRLLELLSSANLVVGNFEGTALDLKTFEGYPEAQSGFGWLVSPPEVAPDLKRLGFNMLSRANNHTVDWGVEGMLMTDRLLTAQGLVCAGAGESLAAARAPALLYGESARAALISLATTFEKNAPAIDALGQIRARPGANTLGTTAIVEVTKEQFAALKGIRDAQPRETVLQALIDFDERMGLVTLFGQHYRANPALPPDGAVTQHFEIDASDERGVLLNVRQAKQISDFAVVGLHAHEPNNWTEATPRFLTEHARRLIDNGADIVCGHGPHQLRGIEIYKGRPIFYSLANFSFMSNTPLVIARDEWERRIWRMVPGAPRLDPEAMTPAEFMEWARTIGIFGESLWFESVLARSTYVGGRVSAIELYPLELHWQGRDADRGIPRLAEGAKAVEILRRLARLSAPMNTTIEIDETLGIGTIRP